MSSMVKMPYGHELAAGTMWLLIGLFIWFTADGLLFGYVAGGSIILMAVGRVVLPLITRLRSSEST